MHAGLSNLAATQDDVVAVWQLLRAGWTAKAVRHRTAGMTRLHSGVFLTSHSPVTQRQRWRAATLTTPYSYLSYFSAAACQGFMAPRNSSIEAITRPGTGGRRQTRKLLIFHSTMLAGNTATHDGIRVITAARTLDDLAPHLDDRALRKAFREALRLKLTNTTEVRALHRGCHTLNALATQYARLQIERTKSDAEAYAVELLDAAGVLAPGVNEKIANEEADLSWPSHKLIIEIDGPQFHILKDEDARKTAIWENAGYTVRRIPSDDVFNHPQALLALAPQ